MAETKEISDKYKERFKSEYFMAFDDFERYGRMLRVADDLGFQTRQFMTSAYSPYFSILKQIYINLRTLLSKDTKERLDNGCDRLVKLLDEFSRSSNSGTMEEASKKSYVVATQLEHM